MAGFHFVENETFIIQGLGWKDPKNKNNIIKKYKQVTDTIKNIFIFGFFIFPV